MSEQPDQESGSDMTPWIAIKVTLSGNRKILKLQRLLSLDARQTAVGIVVDLFSQTFLNEWMTGDWSRWHPDDFEAKLGWTGKAGALVKALQESEFLDGMKVHNWGVHQRRQIKDRLRKREERSFQGGRPVPQDDSEKIRARTRHILGKKT